LFSNKKRLVVIFTFIVLIAVVANANLVFSNRNTSPSPEPITYTIAEPEDMELLYENTNFRFYFRDSTDVLAIYDKRNGITHKTGLDVPTGADVRLDCEDAVDTEDPLIIADTCVDIEDRLNQTWTDFANSLITLEYFDESLNPKKTSSASRDFSRSSLSRLGTDDHWALDIDFNRIGVEMRVHLYFSELGVEYEIRQEQITGEAVSSINTIAIAPFLDAQGGKSIPFDGVEYNRDNATDKPSNDGYILVPDGPGALLRFKANQVAVSEFNQYVYGVDSSRTSTSAKAENVYFEPKQMTLPVFGMSLGNDQEAAFIAYAKSADEYMKVTAMPHNNTTWYNFAYASFIVNDTFFQEFNNNGDGFTKLGEEINNRDIKIQYQFLAGDGSSDGLPASYVGMAKAYREYLIEEGLETANDKDYAGNIPMRVDFLMADVKKDLFGYEDVVVTTLKQIEDIYQDMSDNGLRNINSGLIGYASGGVTANTVGSSKVSSSIGGKGDLESLVDVADSLGYDVSLHTDYVNITELQYSSVFNLAPAKHISGRYMTHTIVDFQTMSEFYYTRYDKALDWFETSADYSEGLNMSSISMDGLSNIIYSEYKRDKSRADNIDDLLVKLSELSLDLNAVNPNAYLLPYVERYLETPMYSSHFLIETDTVPFLQLVLANSMEMYAHYANFNVASYSDILRMVDYNVYPSFVLTNDPSYELEDTNSFLFYSTQYAFYDEEIISVYNEVNNALKYVMDEEWIGRIVLEEGVVMNQYTGGVSIIINYNDTDYNGVASVDANSYEVIQ